MPTNRHLLPVFLFLHTLPLFSSSLRPAGIVAQGVVIARVVCGVGIETATTRLPPPSMQISERLSLLLCRPSSPAFAPENEHLVDICDGAPLASRRYEKSEIKRQGRNRREKTSALCRLKWDRMEMAW
ncbi:hypothetical protein B0T18DRAFT_158228 [Schizothecium vesticola]|uniref:Secreted protein n=1 Tax=Schizothecium vesticola TaxID=314040 RepID=A0AA40EW80_9PEZI|nr:hypothetical protein B0T18DRAFT_158228 [Schizothecium vesticola]